MKKLTKVEPVASSKNLAPGLYITPSCKDFVIRIIIVINTISITISTSTISVIIIVMKADPKAASSHLLALGEDWVE